jgi:hypothetical protein
LSLFTIQLLSTCNSIKMLSFFWIKDWRKFKSWYCENSFNLPQTETGYNITEWMRYLMIRIAKRVKFVTHSTFTYYIQCLKIWQDKIHPMLNPFATGPFLTRVLKPKSSIFEVFFNERLWPNLMKESETVCFIKLTTNCTLFSHKKFHPKNMLIKSHDLIADLNFQYMSAPTEVMHKAMFKSLIFVSDMISPTNLVEKSFWKIPKILFYFINRSPVYTCAGITFDQPVTG